jgi:hypothetical protein
MVLKVLCYSWETACFFTFLNLQRMIVLTIWKISFSCRSMSADCDPGLAFHQKSSEMTFIMRCHCFFLVPVKKGCEEFLIQRFVISPSPRQPQLTNGHLSLLRGKLLFLYFSCCQAFNDLA